MSYDIYLFKPDAGESADEAFERLFNEDDDSNDDAPSPERDAFKERLAGALAKANPLLERFQFDYSAIAKTMKTTEEDARLRWRNIELNSPEDGNGIQIQIEDDQASVTIAYWHKGDDARRVFEEVWQYLNVFQTEAEYLAYDPQLGRPLDLSNDLAEVVDGYTDTVSSVETEILGTGQRSDAEPSKPWWKFW